jgi:hypothetical protein
VNVLIAIRRRAQRAVAVVSSAVLGCVLEWLIICLNVMVFDMPQIAVCINGLTLLFILFFHDTLNLTILEENLLCLNLYALGTILYKMPGNPCRENRGWHTADNRDDAIKRCMVRDRAVVNLATQWCHRNAVRWLARWANRSRVKKVNSDFNAHKVLDERKQPNDSELSHDDREPAQPKE